MKDVIQVEDQWYVLATSSRTDDRTQVLRHGETFALFDRYGDIQHIGIGEQGLYHRGTRFLSRLELMVNNRRPMLLNSTVKQDNSLLTVDLTNPDLYRGGRLLMGKGTLQISRSKLLWKGVHYDHLRVVNYGTKPLRVRFTFRFDADFSDIFEVRGVHRPKRGRRLPTRRTARQQVLGYEGLDGMVRRARIAYSERPDSARDGVVRFLVVLDPGEEKRLYLSVACEDEEAPTPLSYQRGVDECARSIEEAAVVAPIVHTSNEQFNNWLNRSRADLNMLLTDTRHGLYPYAGVPWFNTPFGRDGIITALEYLWLDPSLGRGVLGFLADTQAEVEDPDQDAEPGKILHETRTGEMAALGEVPFSRYYGSVDATPLFVVLAGEYYRRTGDRPFMASIWPNIERALTWIDKYGDADGDGFVEYARHSSNGLLQQGWKDSDDSVFHADGRPASAPIALCEVQGYVYQARLAAAELAEMLGHHSRAAELVRQAEQIKVRFNEAFWCEELGTFSIALDGDKKPCCLATSNAGHVLFSGIADPERADRVADGLLSEAAFSGWGVRTLARSSACYNPMSYHNGSIWPHDNALVVMGLANYGHKEKALRVLTGMFDASIMMDLNRLPELFCGFTRQPGKAPTQYPVACSPQAWASAAVFYMLQACLGLRFSPKAPHLCFNHPVLPDYLHELEIRNLRVGAVELDLALTRHQHDVGVNVLRKTGDVEVAVIV